MASANVGEIAKVSKLRLPFSLRHVAIAVHLCDMASIVATSVVTGVAYRYLTSNVLGEIDQFAAIGTLVSLLIVGVNVSCGLSRPGELLKFWKQVKCQGLALMFAVAIVLGLAFTWKVSSDFSRGAFLTFFPAATLVLVGNRLFWCRLLQDAVASHRLKARRTAVLYPADCEPGELERELGVLNSYGFRTLWHVAIPQPGAEEDSASRLLHTLRGTNVDEIIILADLGRMPELVNQERLRHLPVPIHYRPLGLAKVLCERPREALGNGVLIELQRGSLSGGERVAKAALDRSAAAVVLFLLVPLLAMIAVAVKLESRGPVFFRQTRRGFNGRPFKIWKFRTMRVTEDGAVVRQAVLGDDRVTRVGRLLRRSSLDELPQLMNVLLGEMSIVGPRPHAMSHDDHYDGLIADYFRRQHVLPGLTGWAQIRGARGETPTVEHMQRRVDLDLWYVQNWSFRRDLLIIVSTLWHVVSTKSAY